ncbi:MULTISPECIES: DUF2975 domain-containing protein [unclassified Streptomyces]|uniref:DUF2975 domain-containing protein n=1 Tax=unclassified Streptomyces TaxID=2593676 RepID=UPI003806BBF3
MGQLTVLALRVVLMALFGGTLFTQAVLVPLLGRDLDAMRGDLGYPPAAFLVTIVLGVVTAQVVLVCVWRLVTMVRRGTVFSPDAFRYVHAAIGAFVVGAVLMCALGVLLAPGEAVAPGGVLLVGGGALAVLGVALIVLVLRMLLAQAVARDVEADRMRAELTGVI